MSLKGSAPSNLFEVDSKYIDNFCNLLRRGSDCNLNGDEEIEGVFHKEFQYFPNSWQARTIATKFCGLQEEWMLFDEQRM